MLKAFLNSFRVPDLRNKILFTLFIIVLFRFGNHVPVPIVDTSVLDNQAQGGFLDLLNLFSGGGIAQFSVFSLGIMPYITSSIIIQLMTVVIPKLAAVAGPGRGRHQEDQPDHPLRDGRAGVPAVRRARVPVPQRRSTTNIPDLFTTPGSFKPSERAADRAGDDGRHRADHVARRADHPARRRQRHVDPDLHVGDLAAAVRGQRDPARRRPRQVRGRAADRHRRSSSPWSTWTRASGASRSSTRNGWSGASRRWAAPPTCR